jgi:uncharacterized protein
LPTAPRLVAPHPRIDAVRGCVAVERGPLVYCLESTDNDADLLDVRADPSVAPSDAGTASELGRAAVVEASGLTFIPYHAWGNRGLATMRVWVPEG